MGVDIIIIAKVCMFLSKINLEVENVQNFLGSNLRERPRNVSDCVAELLGLIHSTPSRKEPP